MREVTAERAIKILEKRDNENYTPETRVAHRMAIAAIKECDERKNQSPLAIEELCEMCFEPVWIKTADGKSFWMFVYSDMVMNRAGYLKYDTYGTEWVAYRHTVRD